VSPRVVVNSLFRILFIMGHIHFLCDVPVGMLDHTDVAIELFRNLTSYITLNFPVVSYFRRKLNVMGYGSSGSSTLFWGFERFTF